MDAAKTMKYNNTNNMESDISKLIDDFRKKLEDIFNNTKYYHQKLYSNFGDLMYGFYFGIEEIFQKYNYNVCNELLKIYNKFIILHNNISYLVASYYTDNNEEQMTIVNPSKHDFAVNAKWAFNVILNHFEKLSSSKLNNNISEIKKGMIQSIILYVHESELILKNLYSNNNSPIFNVKIALIREIREKLKEKLNDDNVEIDDLIVMLQNMSI